MGERPAMTAVEETSMNFPQAIASGFHNYADAGGRASRSEYWYWTLFVTLVVIATALADAIMFPGSQWGPAGTLIGIALFLPGVAVSIRRLHDINRSGYWFLIAFTIIGILLLIYWACVPGDEGDNKYGPDPLAGEQAFAANSTA
jgi:uncharacterized membrane protein YhaH (DUF805 family)